MGMVHALQKGELDPKDVSQDVRDAAENMKKKDAKDFASTKTKNLPNKVKKMNEDKKIKMNNLDWGKSTAERNSNLAKYNSLKTDNEKNLFLRKLKGEKMNEGEKIDKYDIGMGYLGNGLTVWDRNREKNGDYMTVAHIGENGKITWYDKQLTPKVKKYIMSLHKKVGIGESMKLKDAMKYEINEDLFASLTDPDSGLDEEQKQAFLEAVSGFNRFNESIYREQKLKDITGDIVKIGKLAEKYIMAEQDDWFDGISVKRDMKSLQESIKMFEATAKEVAVLQQRLESVYEEVGGKLGKYFEINDNELKEEAITLSDMVKKGK